MDVRVLREIGLTDSEIKVYLALLELGLSTTGPIVEKSRVASSKIYEVLEKLMQKGLASFVIKSGTKHFEAASPQRLLDYLKEKQQDLLTQTKEVEHMIPQLLLKQKMNDEKSETLVFKGLKGADTAFEDMLTIKKSDEIVIIGFSEIHEQFQQFIIRWHKKRAKLGIKTRAIYGESVRAMGEEISKLPHSQVKFYPPQGHNPVAILVYADKTLFSLPLDKLWIQVKNKRLADSFRLRFEELWAQDIVLSKGVSAWESALHDYLDTLEKDETYNILGLTFGQNDLSFHREDLANVFKKIHEERSNRGIKARLLFQQRNVGVIKSFLDRFYTRNVQYKLLPYKTQTPLAILTSKNKTIFAIHEDIPSVITINNKSVSSSFMNHFEALWNQNVRVYNGFDDVMNKFASMIDDYNSGDEYFVISATWGEHRKKLLQWFVDYHKIRIKKGIVAKLLCASEDYAELLEQFRKAGDPHMKLTSVKVMPSEFSAPMQINLYKGNKVLFFLFGKDMSCFEIESKEFYDNFKHYFDNLWNQEVRILRGIDAIQNLFNEALQYGHADCIGARGYFMDARPHFIDDWEKRAIASKFKMRNIVDKDVKGHRITRLPFVETHYSIPKEFSNLTVFWLFGNKVHILNWVNPDDPVIFVIENKDFYSLYKLQFDALWRSELK